MWLCGGKSYNKFNLNVKTIIERVMEVQKEVHLCFIDYTKAFDRVRHDEIITQLTKLKIDGKDLLVIKIMFWEQQQCKLVGKLKKIKCGVRQICVLLSDFFLSLNSNDYAKPRRIPRD